MILSTKLIVVKNAASNVMRGAATALIAAVLPPFLTRSMSPAVFGAWSLVLQLGAYLGYLDLGLQTAVGRFVAYDTERNNLEHRDQIVSTSVALLSCICGFGILLVLVLSPFLSHVFPQVPESLRIQFVTAVVIVALAIGVGLPFGVFNAVFVGLQRNEVPAAIVGGSRIVSAITLIAIAHYTADLRTMAVGMAVTLVASYFLQFWAFRANQNCIRVATPQVSLSVARELLSYSGTLTVWTVAMLLINGLDLTLVGIFQFKAIAYYAVAASLVTFIAGMQNAVFAAMISPAASLHARGETEALGRTMVSATRYGTFLLLLTGVPLVCLARPTLSWWVGPTYAASGTVLLQVLVVANMLRLTATPYMVVLIATGQQKLVTISPIFESLANLAASILGGMTYGALGVAFGTLIGSIVGIAGNFFYNMQRTTSIEFSIFNYVMDGLLRPLACSIPLIVFVSLSHLHVYSLVARAMGACVSLFITAYVVWAYGLLESERARIRVSGGALSLLRGIL